MKLSSYGSVGGESLAAYAAKEAYHTIRTNLMFSLAKTGCKTVLFSSSVQGEGKTTSAANVAFSLARSNKKVLLIDCDLRSPRIHRLVKRAKAPGLTNFLSGFNSFDEICHRQVFPNLDVICAGTTSPNPSEMIASEGMASLLASIQKHYDFVIIDTPPVNPVSDALALVSSVDGVVMVVRPGYTNRKDFHNALSKIAFVGGKVLGAIANAVQAEKSRGYGRYGQYGRYGDAAPQEKRPPAASTVASATTVPAPSPVPTPPPVSQRTEEGEEPKTE